MSTIDDKQIQEIVQRVLTKVMGLSNPDAVFLETTSASEKDPKPSLQKGIRKMIAIGADHGGFELKEINE